MSIENFKNPWDVDGIYYPKHLSGEEVLGLNRKDWTKNESSTESKFIWTGNSLEIKELENHYPKFTKILKNIFKLPDLYPNLLDEMHNCTGVPKPLLKSNLIYNSGSKIKLDPSLFTDAAAKDEFSLSFSPQALETFEKLSQNDLLIASAMWIITIIHEEIHRGDRRTNDGYISGQWTARKIINPNQPNRIYEYKVESKSLPIGKQKIARSIVGHRGTDIEILVFKCPKGRPESLPDLPGWHTISDAGAGSQSMQEWDVDKKIKDFELKEFIQRVTMEQITLLTSILE
jgi:hypothetical protein